MPHGYPDWGASAPVATIYRVEDIGELAARLRSPVIFNRAGNVIFIEDFNGNLAKVQTGYSGSGGGVSISSERALNGDFSCKMVTGNAADNGADLFTYLNFPVLSKLGFEVCWNKSDTYLKNIYIGIDLRDGTNYYQAFVRWTRATGLWECYTVGAAWVALTPTVNYRTNVFNNTKLVADFIKGVYSRLITNNLTYDLTGIALLSGLSALAANLSICVYTYNESPGNNCVVYIDGFIVTQNEP